MAAGKRVGRGRFGGADGAGARLGGRAGGVRGAGGAGEKIVREAANIASDEPGQRALQPGGVAIAEHGFDQHIDDAAEQLQCGGLAHGFGGGLGGVHRRQRARLTPPAQAFCYFSSLIVILDGGVWVVGKFYSSGAAVWQHIDFN